MNSEIFKEWILDLLRGMEERSVIVMDHASYNSSLAEKIPSRKTNEADIIEWLQRKNIFHIPSITVPELLCIVNQHKEKYKVCEFDKIAYEMRHEGIRFPRLMDCL
ncbi:uncharacterized protein NPIL_695811 [Nephila pilipes]|uniref:Uncharacterized protein n=1 Tax=Nephila pilipes TaxID=299642 RepID=A0A8X6N7E8_NEPPI|nr:uncharacterized protein NPIL_695811 [Nephila pilipes]